MEYSRSASWARWRKLILLLASAYGAYTCYTGSVEDLSRYEDFMANGVQVEGSVISAVQNPGSRRGGRFTNVIFYRTEAGTPYYHRERARSRRDVQEKITLRYKRDNPEEVLIMEYHTSALNAGFRRALACILAGLAFVALVMLWSCRKRNR